MTLLSSDPNSPNDGPEATARRLRTRVKICGITNVNDALAAVAAGADALGFVFYEHSSRVIDIQKAGQIVDALPPFVSTVGLFVDPEKQAVDAVLDAVALDVLQFHGNESADFASQFRQPYYTVIRVADSGEVDSFGADGASDARTKMAEHTQARGFLFDTFDPGHKGGTGKTFDWSRFDASVRGAILAGGLNSGNVAQAIARTSPYAVDVSSGVERAPGEKCAQRMRDFVSACRSADMQLLSDSVNE